MVRITLFNAIVATFALVAVGASAASDAAGPAATKSLASATPDFLDDEGNPVKFINSVIGDDDDDDYTPEQIEQRSAMRRSKHHHKHTKHHKSQTSSRKLFTIGASDKDQLWRKAVQITWYASHDLQNPQCGNGGGSWQPENSSHIGAVVKNWDNGPQCGEFVKLCNKKANDHCVIVRVIDKCAGCGQDHVDLTKSAFKKLSPSGSLTEGRIHGLQMYRQGNPSPWDLALFGPKLLSV
ncbi:hypothetical protein EX895_004423 [Sporisorium graminicola]|uniref:RlpA-like protein double-psi beta-barrel domain-containing protein n=1 Tax=Sporisorium graminicola TaxID=280036 RepID=A0A4U7KR37_9BASI|nr:hypothetical protein EX895_004423 [Sporisorium graminicola]TKY86783.1 hypothetical protein EX895_004423 [Sporisorium graminicola]